MEQIDGLPLTILPGFAAATAQKVLEPAQYGPGKDQGSFAAPIRKKWRRHTEKMIKHAAVSGILVVLLVAALMYSISPGEVQIVYSAAKNRFSTGGVHSLEEMLPGGGKIPPGSFESFGPRKPPGGSCLSTWLKGPQAVAVLITIAAVVLAGEYRRRRRRKFTIEERMAITLSKAVRHDVISGGT